MLHHRQQLDVREAEPRDVRNELGGELAPRQAPVALRGIAPPRSGMHLVDRHRPIERGVAGGAPRLHPRVIPPRVARERARDGRRLRRQLRPQRKRIGARERRPVVPLNLELVDRAVAHTRHERLPETARAEAAHHVRASVPRVEIADDRHAPRVRRPDDERVPARAVHLRRPRAHLFPRAQPVALAEEVRLVVGDDAAGVRGGRTGRGAHTRP